MLPSSCEISIADSKKSCVCPPLPFMMFHKHRVCSVVSSTRTAELAAPASTMEPMGGTSYTVGPEAVTAGPGGGARTHPPLDDAYRCLLSLVDIEIGFF